MDIERATIIHFGNYPATPLHDSDISQWLRRIGLARVLTFGAEPAISGLDHA